MNLYNTFKISIFLTILFFGSSEALYGQCTDPTVGDLNAKNLAYSPSNLFSCNTVTVTAEWDVESQWPYDAEFHSSTLIVSLPTEFVGTSAENYTVTASDGMIYWDVSSITLTNDEFQVSLTGQIPSGTNISIMINNMPIDLGGAFFASINISQSISLVVADCVPTNDEQSISGNIFSGTGPSIASMNTNCSSTELVIDLTATQGFSPFGPTDIVSYAWTGPNGFTATTEDVSFAVAEADKDLYKGEYSVTVTDVNGCETTGSITVDEINCAAVPVEWLAFEAEKRDETAVLDWSTATEINNDKFEVYRSIDGNSWDKIGIVDGAGTTSTQSDYQFVDRNPNLGSNYYRLKQIDFDGHFEFSDTRFLNFDRNSTTVLFDFYPNPTQDFLFIKVDDHKESYTAEILDYSGKVIQREILKEEAAINMSNYVSGLYLIRIINKSGQIVEMEYVVKAKL